MEDGTGKILCEARIVHRRGSFGEFLRYRERGAPVAIETVGNWYWIVDEVEKAGMLAKLVNARKAKLMMAGVNKTDRLDCHGLNRLHRGGTLPTVWIPPSEVRDFRDLPRTRMVFSRERTRLKNRIHAELAKYGLSVEGATDIFGKRGRELMQASIILLPPNTRFSVEQLLEQLNLAEHQIKLFEERMKDALSESEELKLLQTLPGCGADSCNSHIIRIGRDPKVPLRFTVCFLCWHDATGDRLRGQDSLWQDTFGCK